MRPELRTLGSIVRPLSAGLQCLRRTHGLSVIGWHRVDGTSAGLSTGVDDFRRHLDELERWGARVMPLDEAMTALEAGTLPPRAVALTFDDGYASVLETAWPLLRERGMPATFYVSSGYVDSTVRFPWDREEPAHDRFRLVRADELADAAAQGLDVGSHTVTHPWLPRLEPTEVKRELVESRTALEEMTGYPVTSLAYPTGGWSQQVCAIAEEAGYRVGITVDRGLNTVRTPLLSVRRAFVPHDPRDLRLVLEGAYTPLRPLDTWRARKGPTW